VSLTGDIIRGLIEPEVAAAIDSVPNHVNRLGFDPWGLSPEEAKVYYSIAYRIYRYFRPEIHGIENIPDGRVLIVPNHGGQIPYDGLVTAVACLLKATPPRLVRAMADFWVPTLPWVNVAYSRCGVVVGDPINCRNLLEEDNAILVFPEGTRGSGKVWKHRYQLAPFGRGFMRLALQTGSPVVPVAVIGSEEAIVSVYNWESLAKLMKTPYVPVSPWLPFLGLLAYLPAPVKFHIYFGEPMMFDGPFDDEDSVIDAKVQVVRDRVQQMINDGLAARKSLFF